jgi:hypothetical protein
MKLTVGQIVPLPGGGEGEIVELDGKHVTVRILPGEARGIYWREQLEPARPARPAATKEEVS